MAKKILNEATIRRFQKLANMSPINEMYANEQQYMKEEEADADLAPADDMPPMDDMDMKDDELGPDDEDLGAEAGENFIEFPEAELSKIEDAIPALQSLIDMAGGSADAGEAEDMALDDEEPMDVDPMDAGDEFGPEEDEDLAAELQEALKGINYLPSQAEIVNEVALRVAKRLKSARLHEAKLNKALGRK